MGDTRFRRGGIYAASTFGFGIIWICLGLISISEGDLPQAWFHLIMGGLLVFSAIWGFKTPYAVVSDIGLTVWLAPLRRPRTVTWNAVSSVNEWPQTIEVLVSGERVLRLHVSNVARVQRDDFRSQLRGRMQTAART